MRLSDLYEFSTVLVSYANERRRPYSKGSAAVALAEQFGAVRLSIAASNKVEAAYTIYLARQNVSSTRIEGDTDRVFDQLIETAAINLAEAIFDAAQPEPTVREAEKAVDILETEAS